MSQAIRTVAAIICMCLCEIATAQILPWTINILPLNPRSTEVVHVNVGTPLVCYPPDTAPWGIATSVSGQAIQILVTAPVPCLVGNPPPPWTFTTDVGPLPAGEYLVQTSLRTSSDGVSFSAPELTGTESFVVAAAPSAASIPTLNSHLTAALIALLSFLGVRRIRDRLRPNPAFNRTRRYAASVSRALRRRAG